MLLTALALSPALAHAQTDYWSDTSNGYWDVAANWSLGLPTTTEDVVNNTAHNITFRQNTVTVNSFLNSSTGTFTLSGGTLSTTTFFENSGTGSVTLSGGTLNVGANFLNTSTGSFRVSGATLNVTGNFTDSGTGGLTFSAGATTVDGNLQSKGTLNLTGGTLSGAGASASTLEVDNSFILNGGTLSNFTVNPGSNGGTTYGLTVKANSSNLLSGLVMNAGMNLSNNTGAIAQVENGLTLNGTATVGNSSHLSFSDPSGAESLLGTGSVTFTSASGGNLDVETGTTLTVGSNMLIHTSNSAVGTIGSEYFNTSGTNALINSGTISANGTNSTLTVEPTNFTNSGTLSASNGSTINLNSANLVLNGTLSIGANSAIVVNGGTINNGNTAFTVSSGALTLNGATLQNATVNGAAGSSPLTFTESANTLDNVTINGDLDINNYSVAYVPDALAVTGTLNLGGNGSFGYLVFNNATANSTTGLPNIILGGTSYTGYYGEIEQTDGNTLTVASGTTIHGAYGFIGSISNGFSVGDIFVNNGVINADVSSGSITIRPTNFTNNGTLKADGGTLYIDTTWTNSGTLETSNGGAIYLEGTLNNAGATFDALNTVTGTHNAVLYNGTLTGGNVTNSGSLQIYNGSLNNVILDGGLTVNSGVSAYAFAYIGDGVTFGTVTPTTLTNGSGLYFNGTTNPTFNTELIFGDSNGYNSIVASTPVLTLGSNAFIHGNSGFIGYSPFYGTTTSLINNGTINADVSGGNIYIEPTNFTNNGTLKADGGTLYINTAWTNGGTLETSNGGTIYLEGTLNNASTTFDALNTVTGTHNAILTGTLMGGTLTNSGSLQIQNGTLTSLVMDGGLTLANGSYAYIGDGVTFGTATPTTIDNGSSLYFNGTANPTFNTELIFGNNGGTLRADNLTLTLGSSALVHGTNGTIGANDNDTIINNGTIDADVSGGSLTIEPTNFTNNGALKADGGNLYINTTWMTGGTLETSNGGTIYLEGTLNNTGSTLTLTGTQNAILTGTLTGGNIANSGSLQVQGGQLSNVILDGGLTVNGGEDSFAYIGNGVTFGTATPTTISNNAGLYFNGTANPTFNTELIFGDSSSYNSIVASTPLLTLGTNAFIHGNSGYIGYSIWVGATASIINNGIIDADVSGGDINIQPTNFTNNGTLKADAGTLSIEPTSFTNTGTVDASGGNVYIEPTNFTNNGTLKADGGTLYIDTTWTNGGTLETSNGGTIYLEGTLNNAGSTLTLTGATNAILTGTLTGGNITNSDSLQVQGGQLSNVVLDGGLTVNGGYGSLAYIGNGVTFGTASPTTVSNNGILYFNGTTNPTFNTELIFGDSSYYNSIVASTPLLTLGSNAFIHGNTGYIGYSPYYGYTTTTLINNGTISADVSGGDIYIQPTNFTNKGTLSAINGGTLTLDSSGNTKLNGTLSTDSASAIIANDITINNNNTAFAISSGALTLDSSTLENATVNGSGAIDVASGSNTLNKVTIAGDLNITSNNYTFVPNTLTVSGTTTLGGNSTYGYLVYTNASASTANLGNAILGGTTYTGYYGDIEQVGGNTLTIAASTTLHGAYGYIGDLYSGSGSDTLINQGTINSDSGGSLYLDDGKFTNSSTLEATNGSTLTLNGSTTQFNGGQALVDSTSTLASAASVTQNGGTTTIDGGFILPSNGSLALKGGTLGGSGTVTGNVNNTGGTVTPGDGVGTLTVNGNYTQTTNGLMEIALGGTQQGLSYDLLTVTGSASLAGKLEVNLVNGFTPTVGETFNFLTYGSYTGQFSQILSLDAGYAYDVNYSSGMATLVVAAAAVPETSTFVTAGLMLAVGGLLLRRRQRAQESTQRAA
jgi:fibronectin-binding autotransporter adhesin